MFHTPDEDGFPPYEVPTADEVHEAGLGLIESYESGGLRLALEDCLELEERMFGNPDIMLLLQKLVQVANHARHGVKHEQAAMGRIINKHWRTQ